MQALYVGERWAVFTTAIASSRWRSLRGCRRCITIGSIVEAGGLMSYGANFAGCIAARRRLRGQDSRGTKPADIPVEQPTKFDLIITWSPRRRSVSKCRRACSPSPTR